MILTSEKLKEYAKKSGADLVGVASIDRFEGAPVDMHPQTIFPEAKSVVVLGGRILRGSMRGIEEGTEWSSYFVFGYGNGILGNLAVATTETRHFIEEYGWEAMEVPAGAVLSEMGPVRGKTRPNQPPPNVIPSFRFAAFAAGLGEIGYSKVFLTPEFGGRQRFSMILTDASLEPDPIYDGPPLCDRCKLCVENCPAGAISDTEEVEITIAGKKISWGKIDVGKCKLTHWGFNSLTSPFMAKDMPGFNLDVSEQEMSWKEAWSFGHSLSKEVKYISLVKQGIRGIQGGRPGSICGARGCIRACMDHLEKRNRLNTKFHTPFRKREPWLMEHSQLENKALTVEDKNE